MHEWHTPFRLKILTDKASVNSGDRQLILLSTVYNGTVRSRIAL